MTALTMAPAVGGFGAALRHLRHTRHLSQARLAHAAGRDHAAISRLESGERNPSRAMVLAIATAIDATPEEEARLLNAAGYVSEVFDTDPLVAELDAMLRDETLPDLARHYLRAVRDTAYYGMTGRIETLGNGGATVRLTTRAQVRGCLLHELAPVPDAAGSK